MRGYLRSCPVLAVLMLAIAQPAQEDKKPAVISGTVVNSVTNAPVADAEVTLSGSPGQQRLSLQATTGTDGAFEFRDLDPGTYAISAKHSAFLSPDAPESRPFRLAPATVARGSVVKGLRAALVPYAVVAGRILNEEGEPVRGWFVRALRESYFRGTRSLQTLAEAATDDKGDYRIEKLPPGGFLLGAFPGVEEARRPVSPAPGKEPELSYVAMYYPGLLDASSGARLTTAPGAETSNIDFRLRKEPVFRVAGRFLDADGAPVPHFAVQLVPAHQPFLRRVGRDVRSPEGRFEVPGVLAGTYTLVATEMVGRDRLQYVVPVEVRRESVTDLVIHPAPSAVLSGTVEWDDASTGDRSKTQVLLWRTDEGTTAATSALIQPDGSFEFPPQPPGSYQVTILPRPGETSYVVKATFDGHAVEDSTIALAGGRPALHLWLSNSTGTVDGLVTENDRPAAATVVLVPDEAHRRQWWLFRTTASDETGRYAVSGIPPGSYEVYAWLNPTPGSWENSDFLRSYAGKGEKVKIEKYQQAHLKLLR